MTKSKGLAKRISANPVFLGIVSSSGVIFVAGLIRLVLLQWKLDHKPPMIVDLEGFAGIVIILFAFFIVPLGALVSGVAALVIQKRDPKRPPKEVGRSATIAGAVIGAVLSLIAFYILLPM